MSTPRRYRLRAVEVTAVQFDPEVKPWPKGVYRFGRDLPCDKGDVFCRLDTPEGPLPVRARDWIVTEADGAQHPVTARVFPMLYEPAPAPDSEAIPEALVEEVAAALFRINHPSMGPVSPGEYHRNQATRAAAAVLAWQRKEKP